MRRTDFTVALTACVLIACGSGAPAGSADGAAGQPSAAGAAGSAGSAAGQPSAAGTANMAPTFTQSELAALALLSPSTLPPPLPDASNRFADLASAAAFGQKLFFETRFSGKLLDGDDDGSPSTLGVRGETGKVACAGCHLPNSAFQDSRTLGGQISLGAGWGRRKAPSLLDIGQAQLVTWDGRRDSLYNQPFGPVESPVEMNSSRLYVAEQIYALYRAEYEAIFGAMPPFDDATRFPQITAQETGCQPRTIDADPTCNGTSHGLPGDQAEFDGLSTEDQDSVTRVVVNMGKAIGAYERLLSCGPGRFDQWMAGQAEVLSSSEQRGAQIFVGRGQCVTCHSGPFLSDQKFHNVGLKPAVVAAAFIDIDDPGARAGLTAALTDPLNVRGKFSDGDDGRLPQAVDAALEGAFRTPILRCGARRPSYMHTGQLKTLADVVAFFARGGDLSGYRGTSELEPLALSEQDKQDLVAFLGTLEGPGPAANLRVGP